MSKHLDTDKLFKSYLKEYEIIPLPGLWNKIEMSLNKNSSRKKIGPVWYSVAAGLAILIGLITFLNISQKSTNDVNLIYSNEINNENNQDGVTEKETTGERLINNDSPKIKKNKTTQIDELKVQHDNTVSSVKDNKQYLVYLEPLKTNYYDIANPDSKKLHLKTSRKLNTQSYIPVISSKTTFVEPKKNKDDNVGLVITAMLSPGYSYRTAQGNNPVNIDNSESESVDVNESGLNTLSGGVNIKLPTKGRWSFESGIFLTQAGQNLSTNYINKLNIQSIRNQYSELQNIDNINIQNNTLGTLTFDNIAVNNPLPDIQMWRSPGADKNSPVEYVTAYDVEVKQELKYIEVPFAARYNLIEKKPIISLSAGICTNFLIDNTATLYVDKSESSTGETDNIKPVSYSTKFGLGIEYPLFKKFSLNVEPVFRYFISSVNNSSNEITYRPYSLGVNAGISFKIQ